MVRRDMGSLTQHAAGVAVVVVLSMAIHIGVETGTSLMAGVQPGVSSAAPEKAPLTIAAPDSPIWGRAVLKLNGMH